MCAKSDYRQPQIPGFLLHTTALPVGSFNRSLQHALLTAEFLAPDHARACARTKMHLGSLGIRTQEAWTLLHLIFGFFPFSTTQPHRHMLGLNAVSLAAFIGLAASCVPVPVHWFAPIRRRRRRGNARFADLILCSANSAFYNFRGLSDGLLSKVFLNSCSLHLAYCAAPVLFLFSSSRCLFTFARHFLL